MAEEADADAQGAAGGAVDQGQADSAQTGDHGPDRTGCGQDSAGHEAAKAEQVEDFTDFSLLRSAMYHDLREQQLTFYSRALNIMVFFLGSGAAINITANNDWGATAMALGTTAVGALQVVFDHGARAATHRDLRRRFFHLLAEVERNSLRKATIRARMVELYADEPPAIEAVNAIAHNRAGRSLYGDDDGFKPEPVSLLQRVVQAVVPFAGRAGG